ncbi:MAG: penicillin acylase family protein [Bacteroidota bacterium]
MRLSLLYITISLLLFGCRQNPEQDNNNIALAGLTDEVEVLRDEFGINHIYANNQRDLFFAQGYCAAKDRLFQFEVWRRQATGTVAEILGPRELKRDIGTRLFMYRGDLETEFQYYHPDGVEIINAYTDGVNAYIEEVLQDTSLLPITFKALGILPEKWTPAVVISRHQGLLGNIETELDVARAVVQMGVEKTKEYYWFHPKDPALDLDPAIDGQLLLSDQILELYNAYRKSVTFQPEDILPAYRTNDESIGANEAPNDAREVQWWLGSNNWVTNSKLGKDGHVFMANDPHRRLAVPSLRYWVHLSAPGWNVIGGGEPEIPGVSIGHNDYGAWGLTVFRTDGEDLYVYDLNPDNPLEYRYADGWENMQTIKETIEVKGAEDVEVDLHYTRHGPVTYIDSINHKAYAIRCAWLEPGGSPYLASLRMDQATDWESYREACNYSHIPGENMIWADKEGNIGWQAVGIAPVRRNFSGMVPVPGDGRYEWDGYLPIKEKPSVFNPKEGFFATANQNVTPDSYTEWDAIGFNWSDPYRGERVEEVLSAGAALTIDDMKHLQTDYLSIPARTLVPQLTELVPESDLAQSAKERLLNWDFILTPESVEAGIYVRWEDELKERLFDYFPDPEAERVEPNIQLTKIMQWILAPSTKMGNPSRAEIEAYLIGTFNSAVQDMKERFGADMNNWQYGQEGYKHVQIFHPLGRVVNDELKAQLNTSIIPRGGNQYTPGATGGNKGQTHGATFRIIVDVTDWDQSVGMNSPGQSGDPSSPYYKNLYTQWADDGFFPLYFSREKIESVRSEHSVLVPGGE